MPRPPKSRTVSQTPSVTYFKPQGVPLRELETVFLGLDELEALRLADLEGLYQEQAAAQMGISRPTFSRLIAQAHQKVADALFHGRALAFEGGAVTLRPGPWVGCGRCGRRWSVADDTATPPRCIGCGSEDVEAAPARVPDTAPDAGAGTDVASALGTPGRGAGCGCRGRRGRGCGRRWRGGAGPEGTPDAG